MTLTLPLVQGHRGAAGWAPENTVASIRKAAELGATWVEFDVMLSGDDVPILFHDDKLERITGHQGLTAETSLEALQKLDAGASFDPAFAGEIIPTLEAALALVWELGLGANIEIKPSTGRDVITAQKAVELMTRLWPADLAPPLISSFSRMCLAAAQVLRPDWPRALIALTIPSDWQADLQALDCFSFHLRHTVLDGKSIAQIQDAGYKVAAYTVNEPERAQELVACGLDSVISDKPDLILQALSA